MHSQSTALLEQVPDVTSEIPRRPTGTPVVPGDLHATIKQAEKTLAAFQEIRKAASLLVGAADRSANEMCDLLLALDRLRAAGGDADSH